MDKIKNDEIIISSFDDETLDVEFGESVDSNYENFLVKYLSENGYEELNKAKWSPKAKHKSEKGGLTEAGRKSYNKATGGNLKAPQPGGGPRKRSFCARNAGQIRMHGIDCRKDPDKRACKARRRWKCGSVKKSTDEMFDFIIENLSKRCWEGYKPVKGKKPYEKGSCEPINKDDAPHAPESPEDSAHDVVEEGASLKDEIASLSSEERAEMLRHLRSLKDKRNHRSPENAKVGKDAVNMKKSIQYMSDFIIETLSKRCWEGYKPVKGKKPYSKGSCEPVGKTDIEVAPSGSVNRETYLKTFEKDKKKKNEKK